MKKENNKTIRLSNFVLGEIYLKQNGKIKSQKINKVGYIITENNESYIYDLVDDVVIDLYNEELPDETQMFSIVNRPWENSNKLISHREVKEIIECDESKLTEFPSIARSMDTAYVDKVANHNGRLILLLNQDRLLKADEAEAISQLVSNV